jgi:hypothetical protein
MSAPARGRARRFVDPMDLMCPGCCGGVRPVAPGYWVAKFGIPAPQWSHRDGSALCWTRGAVAQPVPRERRRNAKHLPLNGPDTDGGAPQ